MIGTKKILGVCISKIHSISRSLFLNELNKIAVDNGVKLAVFNTNVDFYHHDSYDEGAESVFSNLPLEYIDALIIHQESFLEPAVVDRICKKASIANTPVVMINSERPDCFCVSSDYQDAFKEMIRHTLSVNNIKKPCFVGGFPDASSDPQTEIRTNCYKSVLDELSIHFDESQIYYGNYWDEPSRKVAKDILSKKESFPDAIICSNDYMAISIIDEFQKNGIKVPEDIIITGFDGTPAAKYLTPKLTTCEEDILALAKIAFGMALDAFNNKAPYNLSYPYKPVFAASSRDNNASAENIEDEAGRLHILVDEMEAHEDYLFAWIDQLLDKPSYKNLLATISEKILENSYICLNEHFINDTIEDDNIHTLAHNETLVVGSRYETDESRKIFKLSNNEYFPLAEDWLNNDRMYLISPLYVGRSVYGYYACQSIEFNDLKYKFKRVCQVTNVVLTAIVNHFSRKRMMYDIENSIYTDSVSGLANLKGITKWFTEFSSKPQSRDCSLAISVYSLPQYAFIYEKYGINDIEAAIKFVGQTLFDANPKNSCVGRITDEDFIVINYFENGNDIADTINYVTSYFFEHIEVFNSIDERDYYVEVNCGCTVVNPGWEPELSMFISLAKNEMFLNRLKSGKGEVLRQESQPKELYAAFSLLVEKNLFTYHFQPIVDAKTGDIVAYEALMRTTGGITMSPLDILDVAKSYNRLYDIEKATMFNVIGRYSKEHAAFKNKNIFINTIPGHFLNEEDYNQLTTEYADYLDHFIFEITEQDSITDEELNAIRHISGHKAASQIAIDDYGTGHSNIVNLIRYTPSIVKIDRFLISDIDKDINKQLVVQNTIEFAKMNRIKVLAEGVETLEELQMIIDLGVDLIQGYYTAKPNPEPLSELPENIKNEIIGENLRLSKYNPDSRIYFAKYGEKINVVDLGLDQYDTLQIFGGDVVIEGQKNEIVDLVIKINDQCNANITLKNVTLKGTDEPTITIGNHSNVVLTLVGENTLIKEGIVVPSSSALTVNGDGNLTIMNNRNYSVGIGSSANSKYGKITFNTSGKIKINSSGDKVISIGGGSSEGNPIHIINGDFDIFANGIKALGVGSANGDANIIIEHHANLKIHTDANESLGIGSLYNKADIISSGNLNILSDGEMAVGIGTLTGESGKIYLSDGDIDILIHCDIGSCMGAITGSAEFILTGAKVNMRGEGASATGFGSHNGNIIGRIKNGSVKSVILSGNAYSLGSDTDKIIITGGNVIVPTDLPATAVNDFDEQLVPIEITSLSYFENQISTAGGSYLYAATKYPEDEKLIVYLPNNE